MTINNFFFDTIHYAKVYIGIALLYFSCTSNNDPNKMEMTLFEPKCRVDTLITNNKMYTYKVITFLVDGYKNTAAHEAKLDSFVCASWDSTWTDYAECVIPIYKKSKYTNNDNIKNNPHHYYEYSQNDFIYQYYWSKEIGYTKTVENGREYFDGVMCKQKR